MYDTETVADWMQKIQQPAPGVWSQSGVALRLIVKVHFVILILLVNTPACYFVLFTLLQWYYWTLLDIDVTDLSFQVSIWRMEDFYTSQNESQVKGNITNNYLGCQSEAGSPDSIIYVVTCLIIALSLPLTLVAAYSVFSMVCIFSLRFTV